MSKHCQKHLGSMIHLILNWFSGCCVFGNFLLLLFTSSSHIQVCCPYELKTYSVRSWGLEFNLFWWMFGHVAKIILNSFLLPSLGFQSSCSFWPSRRAFLKALLTRCRRSRSLCSSCLDPHRLSCSNISHFKISSSVWFIRTQAELRCVAHRPLR